MVERYIHLGHSGGMHACLCISSCIDTVLVCIHHDDDDDDRFWDAHFGLL